MWVGKYSKEDTFTDSEKESIFLVKDPCQDLFLGFLEYPSCVEDIENLEMVRLSEDLFSSHLTAVSVC